MNDKNLERAAKLDTTSISDALDRLGIAGSVSTSSRSTRPSA
jgi:hypothetical protein